MNMMAKSLREKLREGARSRSGEKQLLAFLPVDIERSIERSSAKTITKIKPL